MILEIVFILSIFMIFHAYFGYPVSLIIIGFFKKKPVKKSDFITEITLIITAYNEEKRIYEKLENTLLLDYPKDKFQILVASDGSTDQTHSIVRGFEKDGVELLVIKERGGKENAQKEAVGHARGEIIVFSDVATLIEPDGLKAIVSNFADFSVGCVSSEDRVMGKDGNPGGEGAYVRYEMFLRRLESSLNSLVGLSGSFFAARKDVCRDFSSDMQSDFRTVLNCVKMGLRGVSDPAAIGFYKDVSDEKKEYDRKVRTVVRGLTVFFRHVELLNFIRYGIFSYQYFCHKLLRWLVPFFLCTAFLSNLMLVNLSFVWLLLFFCQLSFYGFAVWGWRRKESFENYFIKIPAFFFVVNMSIFVAWWRYLAGDRIVMWTPTKR